MTALGASALTGLLVTMAAGVSIQNPGGHSNAGAKRSYVKLDNPVARLQSPKDPGASDLQFNPGLGFLESVLRGGQFPGLKSKHP